MPQCHCPPKVGDYFYSDGTFSTEREASKTCIGIVFYVGQHENDGSDYSATGIGQAKCHGYAVAVQDAASNCIWGASAKKVGLCPTDEEGNMLDNVNNPDIDWNGYAWMQKIINAAGGKDKLYATEEAGYPATYYAAVDYQNKVAAPANTSGWFLPAIGQMRNID